MMFEFAKKHIVVSSYLALIFITLSVFWQVHTFDFINYDDSDYIYENSHVLNGLTSDGITWAFTTGYAANWHPLTWLSLMLDCQLFGPTPGLMHLMNLLLHLANTLLLFAVLKKMTGSLWPSAFVAAAFALHPMHVESVAWITERKDVLSTFFLLVTLAAYANYVERRSLFYYFTAVLLFTCGLLAKPMLVTLPLVLLLLDYWPLNRFADRSTSPYRIIIEKIPFLALSAISSVITFIVHQRDGAVLDIASLPVQSRIANIAVSYVRYIGKMFWPQNMAVFYPYDISRFGPWQVALCVLLLAVISLLVLWFSQKQKYLLIGWLWFVITLIPVIGFVQTGSQAFADRYTYISYIGLFIMTAWGISELLSRWSHHKTFLAVSIPIVLATMGIRAHIQTNLWKNSSTLFSYIVEIMPYNYLAHHNLANDLRKHGNTALAIEHYTKTLQIKPTYADAAVGIGYTMAEQGNIAGAIGWFEKALQINPNSAHAHNNLGVLLQKQGNLTEAISHFAKAVKLMPSMAEAQNNLSQTRYEFANALIMQGRLDEAANELRALLKLCPDKPAPMNNLALLMATHPELKGCNISEAIHLASRACELTNYHNPVFMTTLAAAYGAAGRFPEAVETAQNAMKLSDAANIPQLKKIIEYHLTFYMQGKPYIEHIPTPPGKPDKP
jgi:protein O-mannosyl-transferase